MSTQNNSRFVNRILPELARQGWNYRKGRKHVILYPADKTKAPFSISITPSDRYARSNQIKEIRKAGGMVSNLG